MQCPWGCGWEGKPEEYIEHLEDCRKYKQRHSSERRPTEFVEKKPQLKEVVDQEHFEVIACVFNPTVKKWRILSLAEVPWEKGKFEILEVDGKKLTNELELIGFDPGKGETTWIAFSKESILNSLFEDIKSLVETGVSAWAKRRS